MDDWKLSLESGWDNPPCLLTRHGLLPLHFSIPHPLPAYSPVPAWEKGFVIDVCGIPWKRLLEVKKLMSVYKNIVDWDDSGARENFENEKARFWAELNGLHCEISLPAPDLYLDKIDYDAEIDAKLVADLEKPPPQPQLPAIASRGWDSFYLANRVPVTGWCDAEDPVQSNWETSRIGRQLRISLLCLLDGGMRDIPLLILDLYSQVSLRPTEMLIGITLKVGSRRIPAIH